MEVTHCLFQYIPLALRLLQIFLMPFGQISSRQCIEFHYSKLALVARLSDIINEIYYNYPSQDSVGGPAIKARTLNELIERKIIELNEENEIIIKT